MLTVKFYLIWKTLLNMLYDIMESLIQIWYNNNTNSTTTTTITTTTTTTTTNNNNNNNNQMLWWSGFSLWDIWLI